MRTVPVPETRMVPEPKCIYRESACVLEISETKMLSSDGGVSLVTL